MNLRDHQRAAMAFSHIGEVKKRGETEDKFRKKYGSIAFKLPILIHSAGLAPALHFIAARTHEGQREILKHLAIQLKAADLITGDDAAALLKATREADFEKTRLLSREAQRVLLWYKRFTQSELGVEPTEDDRSAGEVV